MKRSKPAIYRGRSKATFELLTAARQIIEAVQPITVRGVCYRLFVAALIESMAIGNTQKISRLLVWAREQGLIPWQWIVDESRQMEDAGGYAGLEEYGRVVENGYRRAFWAYQPHRLIVISEKATVSGILRPVLQELGVPFFAVHGFNSATKVHELAEEIADDKRQTVLLYVGDFDPSGMWMSVVDLPARLKRYGAGKFSFKRVALVKSDLAGLPSFPAKKTDPRYRWFVENYGENAWELDAMNPNDLRGRVRSAIAKYVYPGDWERHQTIEAAERETTKRIAQAMSAAGAT